MTNRAPEFLYMLDEDLYRFANATSPKVDHVRQQDVDTYDRNGIAMVRANGKGISLATDERVKREEARRASGYLWKLPANTSMPAGLMLNADTIYLKSGEKPDHYFLCPGFDMPQSEYVGLLCKMALRLERVRKL